MKKKVIILSVAMAVCFGFGYVLGVNKERNMNSISKAYNDRIEEAKEIVKQQGNDKAEHLTALYPELSREQLFDLSWDAYILNFDYLDLEYSTPDNYTAEQIAEFYADKWLEYMQEDEAEILDYWINDLHINTPAGFVKCCY